MNFQDWINRSGPADWIQAGVATLALILAIYSIIISKKAINTTAKTVLIPKEMYFTDSSNRGDFIVELYNSGPGLAYEIVVSASEIVNYKKKGKNGTWREHQEVIAEGDSILQPNQTKKYVFDGLDVFYHHYKRPIIISYRLANEKKQVSYWNYLMGESKKKKTILMNRKDVILFKLYKRFKVDKV